MLVTLAIAAATDYAIFQIGRYHEAAAGPGPRGRLLRHVPRHRTRGAGLGLTIAGAASGLYFTRLPYFQTMGLPLAVGMVMVIASGLTWPRGDLGVQPVRQGPGTKQMGQSRLWHKVGTTTVRWPGAILVCAVIAALAAWSPCRLPHHLQRPDLSARERARQRRIRGLGPAFHPGQDKPDLLLIETDHDLRNPADFLVIDKIAKALVRVHGIRPGADITRPTASPSSTPRSRTRSARAATCRS
jgi:RND superfamily putative drug exporter